MRQPSAEREVSTEAEDQQNRNNTTGKMDKISSHRSKNHNNNEAESENMSDQKDHKR